MDLMMHVEQLDDNAVGFFTKSTRGRVQESNMNILLVEHPAEVPHREALPCRDLTKSNGDWI